MKPLTTTLLLALTLTLHAQSIAGHEFDANILPNESAFIRRVFTAWLTGLNERSPEPLTKTELSVILTHARPSDMIYFMRYGKARFTPQVERSLWIIDRMVEARVRG